MVAAFRAQARKVVSADEIVPDMPTHLTNDCLLIHGFGYVSLSDPVGWDLRVTASRVGPFGPVIIHKVWSKIAASGAESAPTIDNGATDQIGASVTSYSGVDTTNPIDGTPAGANGGATPDANAPSIADLSTATALLVCAGAGYPASTLESWASGPAGMTKQPDFGTFDWYATAYQQLASAAATGSKTFDTTQTVGNFLASSIALRSAAEGPVDNGSWVWAYGVGMG